MPGRDNRFTIYDALEKSGYFDANPANPYSRDKTDGSSLYKGPVEFPKMLYHPEGEETVIVPAEIVTTPLGPKLVGEQRQLNFQIVETAEEEKKLLEEGWHTHPSHAIRVRIEKRIAASPDMDEKEKAKLLKAIPLISSDARIRELEAEISRLTNERKREVELEAGAEKNNKTSNVAA